MQRNGYATIRPMSPYGFRKEGALRELLWELSNKEFSVEGMFSKYRNNVTFLRRAAEAIGKQYECRPPGEPCGGAPDESRGEYEFEAPALRAPPWPWESSVSDRLFARCVQPVDASTADDLHYNNLNELLGERLLAKRTAWPQLQVISYRLPCLRQYRAGSSLIPFVCLGNRIRA